MSIQLPYGVKKFLPQYLGEVPRYREGVIGDYSVSVIGYDSNQDLWLVSVRKHGHQWVTPDYLTSWCIQLTTPEGWVTYPDVGEKLDAIYQEFM